LLIGLIVRKIDWPRLAELLQATDLRLAALASLIILPLILLLALRWRRFLAQQAIHISYGRVFLLTWAGQFFNSVLPGSTGGDVFKIYQACRAAPDRKSAAATSVIVDRLVALLALVVLAFVGFCGGIPAELNELYTWPAISPWWLLLLLLALALAGFLGWRLISKGRTREFLLHWLESMRVALRPNWVLAAGFGLAVVVHLLTFLSFFLFARALGIDISYAQVLMIVPLVMLLALLPVTINGHGLREVLLVLFFSKLHIVSAAAPGVSTIDTVVALSALLVSNDLLWSIAGGLAYLAFSKQAVGIPTETI
jgi:glycosyltransferase 2 family protein